jgi:hypothetical protein
MTESELYFNYERAIMPQVEGYVAKIVHQEAEIKRLRAERDAVIALSIEQLADGSYLARVPWRKGGYPGSDSGENGPYHFDRHEDAIAAVRRAAGLDPEAAP